MSRFGAILLLVVSAAFGCDPPSSSQAQDGCEVCDGGCSNGLVTMCLALDPPGCGAQSALGFCPGGCTPQGPEACNYYPVDGATSGCVASSATIQQGALQGASAPVAITSFSSSSPRVIVATAQAASCSASNDDGGQTFAGDGAFLALDVAPNEAATEAVPGQAVAHLTAWQNGVLVRDAEAATSGTVSVNVYDPSGGVMGSYDLTFDNGDVEQGTFIAPACDPCTMPFQTP